MALLGQFSFEKCSRYHVKYKEERKHRPKIKQQGYLIYMRKKKST